MAWDSVIQSMLCGPMWFCAVQLVCNDELLELGVTIQKL